MVVIFGVGDVALGVDLFGGAAQGVVAIGGDGGFSSDPVCNL